uniref:C3H1-type domain-containing protein n=1 Tax=Medicago truncatula TaxID=3880 RepID=I3SSA1_MEDTR|nr:unknown [Medicago truncatula]
MREICQHFLRGRCRFGTTCRNIHQQQQRTSNNNGFGGGGGGGQQNTNPFGFGSTSTSASNNHQPKTDPFGFGSQNNGAPRSDFKPNQSQPLENNKWSRSSSKPQNGTPRQSDNNSQTVNHKCTDPEACKRQIVEDFQQEKPLWILTCYGHCKGAPCDIVGDISYEELRAAAYEDNKKGMSLPQIVEKEKNILQSKLVEFNKLLSEPYKMPLTSSLNIQNFQSNGANVNAFQPATQNFQSNGANANAFQPATQNNGPLSVSSFSQLGASLNPGFGRPSAPLMSTPVQPSSIGGGGNFFTPNSGNLFGSGISGGQVNPFPTPVGLTGFPGSTSQFQQPPFGFNNTSSTTMFQTAPDVQLNTSQVENVSVDDSIWLKEKWNPGEIPEQAPPDRFVW